MGAWDYGGAGRVGSVLRVSAVVPPPRMRPWFAKAISLAISLNYDPSRPSKETLGEIGKACDKSPSAVKSFLATPWAQEQIASFHAAVLERLKQQRVEPAVRLAEVRDEAAQTLIAAMRLASENGKVKDMRECAAAILAHTGDGPIQRSVQDHRHIVADMSDPKVLAAILANPELADEIAVTGRLPARLLQ